MKISKEDRVLYLILYLVIISGSMLIALFIPTQLYYFWFIWIIGIIFFALYSFPLKQEVNHE